MNFSEENHNFFRLYYVLTKYGTKALNELLRTLVQQTCSSSTTFAQFIALPQVVNDLCPTSSRGCLDSLQRGLLYPPGSTSTALTYEDLDVTLVTTLLRNVTLFSGSLQQPRNPHCSKTLWTDPTEVDKLIHPLEANVVLLKMKRNSIAHLKEPVVPSDEFNTIFDSVKSLVMNIMRHVGSSIFTEDEIEQYRTEPLSSEVIEQSMEKLFQSLEVIDELKDAVRDLAAEQARLEERVSQKVMHQVSKMTRRTWCCVILSLVLAVLVLGLLVWNRVSLNSKFNKLFEKEERSKGEMEEEFKKKVFTRGESENVKMKGANSLIRVQMKRGETDREIKIRKDRLYKAIMMHPGICFQGKNNGKAMEKKEIDKCIERLLKLNTRAAFLALPTSLPEKHRSVLRCERGLTKATKEPPEESTKPKKIKLDSLPLENYSKKLKQQIIPMRFESGRNFQKTNSKNIVLKQSNFERVPKKAARAFTTKRFKIFKVEL